MELPMFSLLSVYLGSDQMRAPRRLQRRRRRGRRADYCDTQSHRLLRGLHGRQCRLPPHAVELDLTEDSILPKEFVEEDEELSLPGK